MWASYFFLLFAANCAIGCGNACVDVCTSTVAKAINITKCGAACKDNCGFGCIGGGCADGGSCSAGTGSAYFIL